MIGQARYPRIRLALLNITKKANRIKVGDDTFVAEIKNMISRLEVVIAHLKTIVEEKDNDNAS